MPAKSKIERLPDEQRGKIDKLLQNPQTTLDDVVELVGQMGIDDGISRSSLHRRQQKLSVVGERIRRSREMAESLVSRFGDEPDTKVARLNIQFLHSAIMDILSEADDEGAPVTLEPKQAAALARAVSELARAEKADSERLLKVKQTLGKDVRGKIDQIAADASAPGAEKQDAKAILKRIREEVYGIFDEPPK